MTPYIFIFSSIAIVGLLTYLLHRGQEHGVQKFHAENMAVLEKQYPAVFTSGTEYSFYSTGHPYVWVGISYEDAVKLLVNACRGFQGYPQPAQYSLKVDSNRKRAYLVSGERDFNFSKLMHYDEWIASNEDVAKNIANYKSL